MLPTLTRRTLVKSTPSAPLTFHLHQSPTTAKRSLNLPSHLHDLTLTTTMHATASVSGTTLAETDTYEFVEGNVYFPPNSIESKDEVLTPSSNGHTTWCPWKGEASYYDVHVNGQVIENGAWYYPTTFEKAAHIKDFIAFCK